MNYIIAVYFFGIGIFIALALHRYEHLRGTSALIGIALAAICWPVMALWKVFSKQ